VGVAGASVYRASAEVRVKNRLRILRAERELSQAALAEVVGVSRQTINAIETEKYDPSLPLAFKIAAIFDQHIEDIFQPEKEPAMAKHK
jgi:putative transcriptional regulator